MTTTDYVGNPLQHGDTVCWGWRSATTKKRTGRVIAMRDGWVCVDSSADAFRTRDLIRVQ